LGFFPKIAIMIYIDGVSYEIQEVLRENSGLAWRLMFGGRRRVFIYDIFFIRGVCRPGSGRGVRLDGNDAISAGKGGKSARGGRDAKAGFRRRSVGQFGFKGGFVAKPDRAGEQEYNRADARDANDRDNGAVADCDDVGDIKDALGQ